MKMNLNHYYFEIYMALKGKAKEKRKILKLIRENVEAYVAEYSGCTMDGIENYFGKPEDIAASYQLEAEFLIEQIPNNRRIGKIMLWTLCGLVVLFIVFFLALYLLQQLAPPIPTYIK